MISIRKFINPYLKTSQDIFKDIMTPLNKRSNFKTGTVPTIPIYFYRCIGIKDTSNEYYDELRKLDNTLSNLKNSYLKFTGDIPFKNDPKLINTFQSIWSKNNLEPFNHNKIEPLIKLFRDGAFIPNIDNHLLNSSIDEALSYILNLYIRKEPNINLTKIKNFTLKLVSWIKKFAPYLLKDFNIEPENKKNIINPKVVYFGDIKKHEVYFLILLSRLGCDVLYINSPNDGDFSVVDNEGQFSKIIHFPNKSNFNLDDLNFNKNLKKDSSLQDSSKINIINNNATTVKSVKNPASTSFDITKYKNSISPVYKTSNNILKDLLLPLNRRSGFVGKPMPLIPVYFYRYIGIAKNEEEYYNNLYKLDQELKNWNSLYLNFKGEIPIENNTELINKTSKVWRTVPQNKNTLMNILVDCNAFPDLKENIINRSIIKSFSTIIELYLDKEPHVNEGKIKNFTLKILMWIYRYVPNLFKKFDYFKSSSDDICNPRILYYGHIKKHEAYFLIFLSLIGCDILYVNSDKDTTFEEIDKINNYSKVLSLPYTSKLKAFPTEEIIVRHETTAFKASEEISNVIYNEEDGLFKPWQFENYNTHPLTLKTTYDELRLLWHEESRMRPGFKVENNTVYIPNLFAKISGVHNDLTVYWNEFKELKNEDTILFIPKIPYTKINYSKYDLYGLNYCFKDGFIDKETLLKHRLYNFSYLKTPLQNGIIDKINKLIELSPFKSSVDTEFKLKILITILTLDKDILELIQKFDYPFKIPKLLIYDNNEDIFSTEDSITLAFLNLMGFDIVIFTPTGYNNIEQKIDENHYDTYKLEDVKFNLNVPNLKSIKKNKSNSFWSNLFK